MASKQNSIVAALVLDSSAFNKGIKKATSTMDKFGAKIGGIGRNISFAIGLPLLAAAKNAYEVGKAFELIQAKIQGVFGADRPIQSLVNSAKQLGESTVFTATQVGELQLELAKLGKTAKVIDQLEEPILRFAQALDQDLGESAKFIVQTLNRSAASFEDFGTDVEKASYVSDVFARATQLSALSAETLRSSLNYVGAEAAAAGVPFEKTVALLGLLANRGYEGSKAGTKLRYIFTQLAKSGKDVNSAIDQLTETNTSFAKQVELVGVRSAGAASSLNLTSNELKEFESQLRKSAGTTDSFKSAIDKTTFNIEKELLSALEALQIKLFELYQGDLNQFFKELTVAVRNLKKEDVERIGSMAENLGKLAGLGAILAVLGPILQFFSLLVSPIKKLGPILGKVVKYLGTAAGSISSFAGSINGVSGLLPRLVTGIFNFGRAIKNFAAAFGPLGVAAVVALEGIFAGIEKVYRAWKEVRLSKEIAQQKEELDSLEVSQQKYLEGLAPEEVANRLKKNFKVISDYYSGQAALADEAALLEDGTIFNPLRDTAVSKKDYEEFADILARIEASGQNLFGQELKAAALEFLKIKGVVDDINKATGGGEAPLVVFDAAADRKQLNLLKKELFSLESAYGDENQVITEDELARIKEVDDEIKSIKDRLDRLPEGSLIEVVDGGVFDFVDAFKGIEDAIKKAKELAYVFDEDLSNALGESGLELQLKKHEDLLDSLLSRYKVLKDEGLDAMADSLLILIERAGLSIEETKKLIEATEELGIVQQQQAEQLESLAYSFGGLFGDAIKSAIDGTESFGESLRNNLRSAISSAIAQLVKLTLAYLALLAVKIAVNPTSAVGIAAAKSTSAGFGSFLLNGFGVGGFSTNSSFAGTTLVSGSNLVVTTNRGITAQDRIYG